MKIYLVFTLSLFIIGCATDKRTYRLLIGGRGESYVENEAIPLDQAIASSLGGTVTTTVGNPNQITAQATGGQFGIVEESKYVTTIISAYYNSYSTISYSFNSSRYGTIDEKMSITGSGLEASIGPNLTKGSFKIRPELSYKIEKQTYTNIISGSGLPNVIPTSATQSIFVWGGGLALEFPLWGNNKLLLQGDYRVPSRSVTGVSSLSYTSAQLNLLFGKWEL